MHYFQGLREHRPPWGPNCSLLTDTCGGGGYLDVIDIYIHVYIFSTIQRKAYFNIHEQNNVYLFGLFG